MRIVRQLVVPGVAACFAASPWVGLRAAAGIDADTAVRAPACAVPDDDAAGIHSEDEHVAAPSADPDRSLGGASQRVSVEVPEGRLYLDPPAVSAVIPAGSRRVVLPDVLVADLREQPGWQLDMTVTSIRTGAGDGSSPHAVRIKPALPRLIAGGPGGARPERSAGATAGECVVLATATPATGRASYFASATIELAAHDVSDEDVVVDVTFHLAPLRGT